MSKRCRPRKPGLRQQINQAREGNRPLRDMDISPDVIEMLRESLAAEPKLGDVPEIHLSMMQTALRRMVELELAAWLETTLLILRDDYGFTQEQLANFCREFRENSTLREVQNEEN